MPNNKTFEEKKIMTLTEVEEVPFQLLHGELVNHILSKSGTERVKALSDVESIGFSSGYRLIEKITREHPKFKDELELMKFICKDYWMCVFRKQIDNLRTNHQLLSKSFIEYFASGPSRRSRKTN